MILRLYKLLTDEELSGLRSLIARSRFVDGAGTAGRHVRGIKHNREMQQPPELAQATYRLVAQALNRSEAFVRFARPKVYAPPLLSCYEQGMSYGEHVDEAILPAGGAPMRTDLSITIFLSDPGSYQGGELLLQTPCGAQSVKLDAGDAVCYSTRMLHQVREVTSGKRCALVTWAQSLVADPGRREILADVQQAMESASPESRNLLFKTYTNLMKMWAEV